MDTPVIDRERLSAFAAAQHGFVTSVNAAGFKAALPLVCSKLLNAAGISAGGVRCSFQGTKAFASYSELGIAYKGQKRHVGATLNLPALAADRTLTRSVANRWLGYALHEMLHVALTPRHAWDKMVTTHTPFRRQLVNAVEDARIEHAGMARGICAGFANVGTALVANMLAEGEGKYDPNVPMNFPWSVAVMLRNYEVPGQKELEAKLHPKLRALFNAARQEFRALDPLTSVFDDAVRIANNLADALQQMGQQEPPPQPGDGDGEPGDGEGDEQQKGEGKGKGKSKGKQQKDDAGDEQDDAEQGEGAGEGEEGEPGDKSDDGEGGGDGEEDGEEDGEAGDAGGEGEEGDEAGEGDGEEAGDAGGEGDGADDEADEADGEGMGKGDGEGEGDEQGDDENNGQSGGGGTPHDSGNKAPVTDLRDYASIDTLKNDEVVAVEPTLHDDSASKEEQDACEVGDCTLDYSALASEDSSSRFANEVMARARSAGVRTQLRRLLQRTDWMGETRGLRRGRLVTSAIARTAVGDTNVFSRRWEQEGEDVAVSIVIDCSGSMCGRVSTTTYSSDPAERTKLGVATKVALVMAECMASTPGVRVEVLGFPGNIDRTQDNGQIGNGNAWDMETRDMYVAAGGSFYNVLQGIGLVVVKTFSENIGAMRRRVRSLMSYDGGGTPDLQALDGAARRLLKQPASKRILFMLCDGAGHGTTAFRAHVDMLYKRHGILSIGLGIGCNENFPARFRYGAVVQSVETLADDCLRTLINAIERERA